MGKKVTCPRCKGQGTVQDTDMWGLPCGEKTCPNCGGTGYVYEKD